MFVPKSVTCLRNYDSRTFLSDLFAGVTVGVVALPLAMAFAIASGVTPERGIYTAVVAGFLISALGGSKVQIGGPTGAFVTIVAAIVAKYGYPGLVLCTFLAGALLVVMGLCRFGGMIKFIPFPVVTGFTSGIAVVIFSSQMKDFFGIQMENPPAEFFPKWLAYWNHLHGINFSAAAIGIGTVAGIFVLRRLTPKVPAMLVAMLLATAISAMLKLPVETIGSKFHELPRTLPSPSIPHFDLSQVRDLMSPALTVALLAAIESLLSATVADGMTGGRHKSNMELVAQGFANIGSVIFGGIPATGAIARTVTNIKSGAKTPVAGMIHALVLLIVLLVFAPLAKLIPLSCLAGILVVISYQMSEIDQFRRLLRAPRSDVMVLLSTFAITVIIDLTVAVQVGVVLASLLFIKRMGEVTNVGAVTREFADQEEKADPNAASTRQIPAGVEVYEINGPFFFGAAESFKETLRFVEPTPKALILRMRNVPAIDATGLHLLHQLHQQCLSSGTAFLLSDVHAQPVVALMKSDLWREIGESNITGNIDSALDRARELLHLPAVEHTVPFIPTVEREKDKTDK
ncbi:MAG: sulfate permease [Candidatus Sumerlaeaceae bacterium]|nr:sulfate permease [Candidatus Sumerlaeaceae bacterium]